MVRKTLVFLLLLITSCTTPTDENGEPTSLGPQADAPPSHPDFVDAAPIVVPDAESIADCLKTTFPLPPESIQHSCSRNLPGCMENITTIEEGNECFSVESLDCERCLDDEFWNCHAEVCESQMIAMECCMEAQCPTNMSDCVENAKKGVCSTKNAVLTSCFRSQKHCFGYSEICLQECQATTCIDQNASCGVVEDGCGSTLNCGACSGNDTCGGNGVPNQCGCTLRTCGSFCGEISDGCGGTLSCGGCTGMDSCGGGGTDNQCGCMPTTCASEGVSCGFIADQCGDQLNCGECPKYFDYEITSVSTINSSAIYNQPITLKSTIRNNGVDSAPSTMVRFVYSTNSGINTLDTTTCSTSVPSLVAGASVEVEKICKIPSLTSGNYYLGAIVDPYKSRTETNETNNSTTGNQLSISAPNIDLEYRLIWDDSSWTKHVGDVVHYNLQVANLGSDAVPNFQISLHYSLDNNITSSDPLACTKTLSGFPANTVATIPFTCTIPNISPGYYFRGIRIDPNNAIPESDETNNVNTPSSRDPIQP